MKYFFYILLLFFWQNMFGQNNEQIEHLHKHHNEIGVANGPIYFINEKEFSYGIHIHFIHSLDETKYGVGVGYERIFDKHKHNTITVVGSYRPIDKLSINLSPGITFEDKEISKMNFAIHLETSYEFQINDFHVGPIIEFAYEPEDYHISLGIHIGYGF